MRVSIVPSRPARRLSLGPVVFSTPIFGACAWRARAPQTIPCNMHAQNTYEYTASSSRQQIRALWLYHSTIHAAYDLFILVSHHWRQLTHAASFSRILVVELCRASYKLGARVFNRSVVCLWCAQDVDDQILPYTKRRSKEVFSTISPHRILGVLIPLTSNGMRVRLDYQAHTCAAASDYAWRPNSFGMRARAASIAPKLSVSRKMCMSGCGPYAHHPHLGEVENEKVSGEFSNPSVAKWFNLDASIHRFCWWMIWKFGGIFFWHTRPEVHRLNIIVSLIHKCAHIICLTAARFLA